MQKDRRSSRLGRKERHVRGQNTAPIAEMGESEKAQSADTHTALAPHSEQPILPYAAQGNASPRQRMGKRSGTGLRASLAVVGGRTAGALSRRLHLGGGTSIAGVVAQRLYPDIIEHLSTQLQQGSILVTGTNGKTTTSGFIAAILKNAGLRIWRNREGSNLLGGIAGALVIRSRPSGQLRRAGQAISIFEVDEAVMPQAVSTIPTRVAVFTNLFRDQLDRYGEVESVLARWQQAISALTPETILVLNADDPAVANLGRAFAGRVVYFGIEDAALDEEDQQGTALRHQVVDTRVCPNCGGEYTYTLRFYSHIGHYVCSTCGMARPRVEVAASKVTRDGLDRLRIQVALPTQQAEVTIPLPGIYNIYNVLAAIATAQVLGIAWEPTVSGIAQFKPAFGRGERVQVQGRTLRLLLAKNPTGFNEVLRTLFADGEKRHVLFVLNDKIADGRDVSWIWDVDFEQAMQGFATLTVAGTRARDLALRLKYAGWLADKMLIVPAAPLRAARKEVRSESSRRRPHRRRDKPIPAVEQAHSADRVYGVAQALTRAISQTPEGETLFIVPTYTGLLEVHRELERRGLTPRYWEEAGP